MEEQPPKRLRVQQERFALVSCHDDSEKLVEVDLNILEPFNCRLFHIISKDVPSVDKSGRIYWRCGHMTRAMLLCFLRSLLHGELSLSKGVALSEAVQAFEFECVSIGKAAGSVRRPRAGVAFGKKSEPVSETVKQTSEQVADALAAWPRLEAALESALKGWPSSVDVTCTATRAWIRFCPKPHLLAEKGDATHSLARRWPPWCSASLIAIGAVRETLIEQKKLDATGRDAAAYGILAEAVDKDSLGCFFATTFDSPRHWQDRHTRKALVAGQKFANDIRASVLDGGLRLTAEQQQAQFLCYARACFALAESVLHRTPSPASIFSGVCADEGGKSLERQMLTRALKARGINVVRWSTEDVPHPLLFPPSWSEGQPATSSQSTVLLDFSNLVV